MINNKTNPFIKTRLTESQELLRSVMSEALGIYMAKEPKNEDQWRDQDFWQILSHLKHEIEEIERSHTLDRKYHNTLDCIGQAAILAAHLRLNMKPDGIIRKPHTPDRDALADFRAEIFKICPELGYLTEEDLRRILGDD